MKRYEVWKLKQAETKGIFSERMQTRAVLAIDDYGDVKKGMEGFEGLFS